MKRQRWRVSRSLLSARTLNIIYPRTARFWGSCAPRSLLCGLVLTTISLYLYVSVSVSLTPLPLCLNPSQTHLFVEAVALESFALQQRLPGGFYRDGTRSTKPSKHGSQESTDSNSRLNRPYLKTQQTLPVESTESTC